jgi:hypothetical protein
VRPRSLLFLLLLIPAPAPAQSQAPRLDVTLKPQQATQATLTVGDPIEAVLTLHAPTAALAGEPRFPVWGASWGDAEILEKGAPEKIGEVQGTAGWRQRIVIAAYRTGKIELPPMAVDVPLKDRTLQAQTPAGLKLEVLSVLPPNEKDPQPKPAATLRRLPLGAAFWWTCAGMAALSALLVFALWRRSRRRRAIAGGERPAPAPFAELNSALDALDSEPSMLRLHTQISLALRRYLSRTFAVPALESTTSDLQRVLTFNAASGGRRPPSPLVRQTVELLRACDLVKFARLEVGETRGRERLATARQLARDLELTVQPTVPAVPSEPPARLEAAG